MNAFDARLKELRRRILDAANTCAPQYRDYADTNATIELHDLDERLMCCATDEEADALVRRWTAVWA